MLPIACSIESEVVNDAHAPINIYANTIINTSHTVAYHPFHSVGLLEHNIWHSTGQTYYEACTILPKLNSSIIYQVYITFTFNKYNYDTL